MGEQEVLQLMQTMPWIPVVACFAMILGTGKPTEELVRLQYEKYPYPPYVPQQYSAIVPVERLGDIHVTSQYIWGGRRNFTERPLRVLVAGCGTGTAVLYYGLQFAAYSPNSTIVCMDISQASLDIARDRTKAFARHFSHIKVEFLRNSILELPSLKLANFDLINCIGVLHHMEDYHQGLVNLRDNLNDDGGMVIMLYGCYGREGVYAMQEMVRSMLNYSSFDRFSPKAVKMADILKEYVVNGLKSWPNLAQFSLDRFQKKYNLGSTITVDDFLHPQDKCFTVENIHDYFEGAGMQISSFYNPTKYNPVAYRNHDNKLILGPKVRRVVRSMWWYDQAAIAEKMSRSMIKHSFYAVKRGQGIEPVRDLTDDTVPMLKAVCSTTKAQAELSENIDELLEFGFTYRIQEKIQYHFPIPKLAPILVSFFDGSHTVREIVDEVS